MKQQGRVAWDGLVMCKGEQLMHQWGRVSGFNSAEQKKVEEDMK